MPIPTVPIRAASALICLLICLPIGRSIAQPAPILPDPASQRADSGAARAADSRPAALPMAPAPDPEGSLWREGAAAAAWSIGATLIPVWAGARMIDAGNGSAAIPGAILFLGGMALGPSAGQWYLGSGLQGGFGAVIRSAGMVVFISGLAKSLGSAFCGMDFGGEGDDSRCPEGDPGKGAMTAGAYIYLAGAAYSLIDIPFAAKRERERENRYGWVPVLQGGPKGAFRPGLAAWTRF